MATIIEEVNKTNLQKCENYTISKPEATFVDNINWRKVVEKVYGLSHHWYIAKTNENISGFLGLTMTENPVFGKYLATAPFANNGGFYADNAEVLNLLFEHAKRLQQTLRTKYTVIRNVDRRIEAPAGWFKNEFYATYHLPLDTDPDRFFRERLRSKIRNTILRAKKNGFTIRYGQKTVLNDFWHILSLSMKELGSPYHSKKFLKTLLNELESQSEMAVIYTKDGKPTGAALMIFHQQSAILLNANCLTQYRALNPGEFLYWSLISECCRRRYKIFDMGRSIIGSGNEHFKMKWRPIKKPLAYWFRLSPGIKLPNLNQENPRYKLPIKIWQHMPLWLIRLAGPRLISGIL